MTRWSNINVYVALTFKERVLEVRPQRLTSSPFMHNLCVGKHSRKTASILSSTIGFLPTVADRLQFLDPSPSLTGIIHACRALRWS